MPIRQHWKIVGALSDAQVDLNPHQIEAALFAFRSPLSRGVILADEVGLGKTIKAQFSRLTGEADFTDLQERLRPICKRTLRKQVLEYIKYTNRHALVQEFVPSDDEQKLYDKAATDITQKKDQLIDSVESKLKQNLTMHELFTIRFEIR